MLSRHFLLFFNSILFSQFVGFSTSGFNTRLRPGADREYVEQNQYLYRNRIQSYYEDDGDNEPRVRVLNMSKYTRDPFCAETTVWSVFQNLMWMVGLWPALMKMHVIRAAYYPKVTYCAWAERTRRALNLPWVDHGLTLNDEYFCQQIEVNVWKWNGLILDEDADYSMYRVITAALPCAGSLIISSRPRVGSSHLDHMFFLAPVTFPAKEERKNTFKIIGHSKVVRGLKTPDRYKVSENSYSVHYRESQEFLKKNIYKWEYIEIGKMREKWNRLSQNKNKIPENMTAADFGYIYEAIPAELRDTVAAVPKKWTRENGWAEENGIDELYFGPMVKRLLVNEQIDMKDMTTKALYQTYGSYINANKGQPSTSKRGKEKEGIEKDFSPSRKPSL